MAKKILFVLRKAPHSGAYTYEALDVIMTAAAFDQEVNILLLDDGVFAIKAVQNTDTNGIKNTAAMFAALAVYNIQNIFVETESLQEKGLNLNDLSWTLSEIPREKLGEFMGQFDVIF